MKSIRLPIIHYSLLTLVVCACCTSAPRAHAASTTTPSFSPPAGTYFAPQTVTLTSEAGSTVFYTTDGTDPTNSSSHGTVGAGSASVSLSPPANVTIIAYATNTAKADSPVASASYVIIMPASGTWTNTEGGTLSWKDSTNWLRNVIAVGSGFTADFSTLTMTADTTVTLDGAQTVGNLIFGDMGSAYNWALNTGTGGPLTLDAGASTPTITVSNTTATVALAFAGTNGWIKAGSGALTLSSKPNSIGGTATVNGGTLNLGGANSNDSGVGCQTLVINNGGTVSANTDNALGRLANIYLNTGGTMTMAAGRNEWLTQGGTLTLAGGELASVDAGNTTYGTWILYNVVVSVTDDSTISAQMVNIWGTSTFTVAAGKTLNVSGSFGASGTGGLIKNGPGTCVLSGNNTSIGTITVDDGTLRGIGVISSPVVINSGATLAAGDATTIGTLNIDNTLTLSSGSTNLRRISKDFGTATSDLVQGMTGPLNYGGTLVVTNITSGTNYPLASGDTFTLFTLGSGGYGGGFANIVLPPLPAGLAWDTTLLTASGQIAVSTVVHAATPTFNPSPGSYPGAQTIAITSSTANATIFYTTDDWATTNVYTAPVSVPADMNLTIRAYAHMAGGVDSPVASATYLTWPTLTWINPLSDYWATAANWSNNIVAAGSGVTADFSTLTMQSDIIVSLTDARTIGNMIFGDVGTNYDWILDASVGGPLTLDAGTNTPTITARNMTTTIIGALAGTNGWIKAGSGALTLANKLTLMTGTATVNGGTLNLAGENISTSAVGSALVINGGGTVDVNSVGGLGGLLSSITINSGGVLTLDAGSYNWLAQDGTVTLAGGDLSSADSGDVAYGTWMLYNTLFNVTQDSTMSAQQVNVRSGSGLNLTVAASKTLNVTGGFMGGAAITKNGSGTCVLSGTNTHTGSTILSNGTLLVNGSLASASVTVAPGATLGGTGTIGGAVTVNGVLTSGSNGLGTLAITNALTLHAGSTTTLAIDRTSGTANYGNVQGITAASLDGTLTVTSLGGTFQAGDTFTLISASTLTGDFAVKNLPVLAPGLVWQWTPASGTLHVVAGLTPPALSGIEPSVGGFALTFSGPSGQTYKVLGSTNVALPLTNWSVLTSGTFGASPVSYTNTPATAPREFYRVVSP